MFASYSRIGINITACYRDGATGNVEATTLPSNQRKQNRCMVNSRYMVLLCNQRPSEVGHITRAVDGELTYCDGSPAASWPVTTTKGWDEEQRAKRSRIRVNNVKTRRRAWTEAKHTRTADVKLTICDGSPGGELAGCNTSRTGREENTGKRSRGYVSSEDAEKSMVGGKTRARCIRSTHRLRW